MAITIDGTNGLTTDNAALKLDGTTLVVDDTNNRVGIGTSSPSATLDARISGTSSGAVIQVGNTGSGAFGGLGVSDGGTYPLQIWGSSVAFLSGNSSYASATERMRIDSAGRVTMPYQPAFRATSDNGSQSLTNNVTAVAVFDVAETNIGGHYNTANGKFTAPVSGFYSLSSSLLISQGGANRIDLMFYKNGSPWVSHEFKDYGASSSNSSVTASMSGYLSSNDFVEVVVMLGGANGSIYSEPKFWNFSGFLIG